MMKRLAATIFLAAAPLFAQVPGLPTGGPPAPPAPKPVEDSTFVFTPARPLIDSSAFRTQLPGAFGLNILFSGSGYGAGFFYEKKFSATLSGFIDVGISGARKGDEFEFFNTDPTSVHYGDYSVPNKVNRVWHAPVMLGAKKTVLGDVFFNNFRPFLNAGIGPDVILTTPYEREFFSAFGDGDVRVAVGGFVGAGAEFSEQSPGTAINLRYYYIPVDPGIESIRDEPITNFGGLFLTLNVPF